MKVKIIGEKMLAQCPDCGAIKMETDNKYRPIVWQKTFVIFNHLPKEKCYPCSIK